MITTQKNGLDVRDGVREILSSLKKQNIELNDFVLSYATDDNFIFHSKDELREALKPLIIDSIQKSFNETYRATKNPSEAVVVTFLTRKLMLNLHKKAQVYFLTLQDFVEDYLLDGYIND